jgi:aldehyde dehydrogenase (NAD+)
MNQANAPIRHADRFFIGGQWVAPSSDATIGVIDSGTEEPYFSVAEAQAADVARAVEAAREAFDNGPWPWLTHAQRAEYLRALGAELEKRSATIGQIWPREVGVLHAIARNAGAYAQGIFNAARCAAAVAAQGDDEAAGLEDVDVRVAVGGVGVGAAAGVP